ncbi:restriction endonuclease subunit S [Paracoccus sp. ME4]|uniref:restriction endonuclease subunit S n=1 Tax=Paracoccus sp. ME4 TaxID=3138066 RepID=UPI00398B63DB
MTRRYPAYRESGVEWLGEVPEGWDVVSVKRAFNITLGKMLQNEQRSDDDFKAPYLRAANVQWGRVDVSDIKSMWFSSSEARSLALVAGDLLVSEGGDVGRSAIWQSEIPNCFIQNSVHRVRALSGNSSNFLYYWMVTIKSKGFIDVLCNKSTIAHFTVEKFAEVPMPLPTFAEQTAIAAFLDQETAKIDALVDEQRRLITLLREKRQAVISHAVTKGLNPAAPMKPSGVDWLGDVPERWEVKRLKNVVPSVTVGIVVEPSKYYVEAGVPALRSLNVRPGKITAENLVFISDEANELQAKSKLNLGDIVAVRTGQPGTCAVVTEEFNGCNCIDLIIIRRPTTSNSQYLFWYLNSDFALRQFSEGSGGAIQLHFNVSTATELVICVPPIDEQHQIVRYLGSSVSALDQLVDAAGSAICLLQERRAAIISAAVTGKIDVRDLAAAETEAA